MKGILKIVGLLALNVLVFISLAVGTEIYFRIWGHEQKEDLPNGLWQMFQPYVMFTTAAGNYPQFYNTFTHKSYPSSVKTNSLGFNDPREFSLTEPYRKVSDEKVVLFTGGSAAWGVGATATDRTVAGRMQYYLNAQQSKYRYTVVNLAMGSWIAFQQSIALQLWGARFDPDWVVSMDGFNDAAVGCGYSQGVGNPMYFATTRSYIDGYLMSTLRPVFYRGRLENDLIKHSKAYRILTGKQYVPDDQVFDETSTEEHAYRRQILPTKVGASRDVLRFYIETEAAMLRLFPRASYILSTQPVVNQFTGDFNDIYQHPIGSPERKAAIEKRTRDLEQYLTQYQDQSCGQKTGQQSFTYIFGNGAVQLEQLADAQRAQGRHVEYFNTGTLFPDARQERMPFFIDPPHLTDKGMDVIGKFYAEKIIAAQTEADTAAIAPPPITQVSTQPGTPQVAGTAATGTAATGTSPAQMAALMRSAASKFTWDTVEGVRAEVVDGTSHVPGQPTLRLTATDSDGRHAAAVRFALAPRDGAYRVTLWVKGPTGSRIMMEMRDSVDPHTGLPGHYGVAQFDLSSAKVVEEKGDIQNPAIVREGDGWSRVSVDVKTGDGRVYALVGMLEGTSNYHIFKGTDKFQITIGGIDVGPL
jgi:hypothetical protein